MLDRFFALYCPDCGEKIKDDDEFCPHCGTNLDMPINQSDGNKFLVELDYLESAQQIYDTRFNLEEALLNCELALENNPELASAHNLRGLILDDMGQTEEAIKAYRKALEINPSHEDARANLSDAELEMSEIVVRQQKNKNFELNFSILSTIIKLAIIAFVVLFILGIAVGLFVLGRL